MFLFAGAPAFLNQENTVTCRALDDAVRELDIHAIVYWLVSATDSLVRPYTVTYIQCGVTMGESHNLASHSISYRIKMIIYL